MTRALICIAIVFQGALAASAQSANSDSLFVIPDSVKPLTLDDIYKMVIAYHPVVKQANLLSEVARQEIRLARGGFDPKLTSSFSLKHFNNTEYYRLFDGSLKFPNASPLTPTVGLERNKGQYVNPENYISNQYDYQQLYTGVAIPLGSGLITDERRTAVRQAELFREQNEADQIKMINKVLLEVVKEYWEWYYAYYNFRVAASTVGVAEEILRRTVMSYEGGENALIDTVQARITYLERKVSAQEAYTHFLNSTQRLSVYMWDSTQNPVNIPLDYAPVTDPSLLLLSDGDLEELRNQARENHPELRTLSVKLRSLELERRLAAEFLKPQLDLSYYFLNRPFSPEGVNSSLGLDDNYKFGVDFSFPLFLRKERAKLAQTRLKITTTRYDRDLTERQIINEINIAYNQLRNNGIVLQRQREMVDQYERLMQAELLNLENGESDLFKINIQQEKLFNAQSKLIKVIADYEKQKAQLYWAAGVRPLGD
jgi:outer membrane protein TolC